MNEEILKRLDALAAKLGVGAEHLWGVLLKQARVEMWTDLAVVAISIGVIGLCIAACCWAKNSDAADDDLTVGLFISGLIIGGIALFFACGYGFAAVTEGANPEYWALKQLLAAVK